MKHAITDFEKSKYERLCDLTDYHVISPAEYHVKPFLQLADPQPGDTILDVGCGPGRVDVVFEKELGLKPILLDFTPLGLDEEAKHFPFYSHCIWQPFPVSAKYVYCIDVMEHIPPQFTMLAVNHILDICEYAFFNISHLDERYGGHIGEQLHLSIYPFQWWRDSLREMGDLIDARDLISSGIYYVKGRRTPTS